jgi:REP element-mobilizing transposase RayT
MVLNRCGRIVHDEWLRSADVRMELRLDGFVVMPNHIHGIVFIDALNGDPNGANGDANGPKGDPPVAPTAVNGPRPRSLGSFIAGYKSAVTTRINQTNTVGATGRSPVVRTGQTIWQRNYHDHIVRNDSELTRIRQYNIQDNPRNWETDDHHVPENKREI